MLSKMIRRKKFELLSKLFMFEEEAIV